MLTFFREYNIKTLSFLHLQPPTNWSECFHDPGINPVASDVTAITAVHVQAMLAECFKA